MNITQEKELILFYLNTCVKQNVKTTSSNTEAISGHKERKKENNKIKQNEFLCSFAVEIKEL